MMVFDTTARASARPLLSVRRLGVLCSVGLIGLMSVGCGNEFSTGVPPNTVLDEASDEDLQDICLAVSSEFVDIAEGPTTAVTCTIAGLVAEATGVATCAETRSACIAEAEPADVTVDCTGIDMSAFDACDTTVGEAEQCVRDLRSNIEAVNRAVTCSLDPMNPPEFNFEELLPPECEAAATECPALAMLLGIENP